MTELPPPPAYSEEEFDQKIFHATQLSIDHAERDDEWETWDEAAFEAAATNMQRHSFPRLSGTQETLQTGALVDHHSSARPISEIRPAQLHPEILSGNSLSDSEPRCAEADLDTCGPSSSHIFPPLPAPAYASVPPPAPTLADAYGSSISGTFDHRPRLGATLDIAVPLADVPTHRQSSYPRFEVSGAHAASTSTDPSARGLPSMPISSLTCSASPNMNFNVEHKSPIPQQHPLQLKSSAILDPKSSLSPQSVPSSRSRLPSNSSHFQDYNSNRTANLTPQTMQAPRINVDLSMMYGKRPAVSAFQEFAPSEVPDVSVLYNSSVSAHLGPKHPKATVNLPSTRRQSHQPPSSNSLYNSSQATHSMPDGYGPPHATPMQGVYNLRPSDFTLQNSFIRSPTPTYPAGHSTNPMPQILAAADEDRYNTNYSPTSPYPAAWTESSNSYR